MTSSRLPPFPFPLYVRWLPELCLERGRLEVGSLKRPNFSPFFCSSTIGGGVTPLRAYRKLLRYGESGARIDHFIRHLVVLNGSLMMMTMRSDDSYWSRRRAPQATSPSIATGIISSSSFFLLSVSTIDSLETRPFCRSFAYIQSRKGRGKKGGASKRKRAGIPKRERKGAHWRWERRSIVVCQPWSVRVCRLYVYKGIALRIL